MTVLAISKPALQLSGFLFVQSKVKEWTRTFYPILGIPGVVTYIDMERHARVDPHTQNRKFSI